MPIILMLILLLSVGTAGADDAIFKDGAPQCPGECYWLYDKCVDGECKATLFVKVTACQVKMEAAMRAVWPWIGVDPDSDFDRAHPADPKYNYKIAIKQFNDTKRECWRDAP